MITGGVLRCPGCRETVTSIVAVNVAAVAAGTPVLCAYCGQVGAFVAGPLGMWIRSATLDELHAWAANPRVQHLAAQIRATVARLREH